MPNEPTATFAPDQRRATAQGRATQEATNHGATTLVVQDEGREAGYVIYVYNILNREYIVQQPPLFSSFRIPACQKGEKFSFTTLPAFVNERYEKSGTTEYSYKRVDGRKCATSLLNPDTFPGTDWNAQLIEGRTGVGDQTGNNLNAFGVFWSLTKPDDPNLTRELDLFKKRVNKTMQALIDQGNTLNASGDLKSITPLMHFAMEYFNLQANWHMSHEHKIACPNCGEPIREGLAYHRNQFGDKCIIDRARYDQSVERDATPITGDTPDKAARAAKGKPKEKREAA